MEGENIDQNGSNEVLSYGDYEIVKPIGKGKFAVVYRATRKSTGETVALKRISVDMIDNKARDKCLKEVRLLQSLDHPNIIHYMDSFISENDLVIVFEWAAAGDLKRQLRKAQERNVGFDERVIWKYFSQICEAMKHMHDKRIMHRDLKPANIFLTLDGTIKVGDLGLSRELSEHTVQAHSKVGTPLYMSPEVLRGDGYDFKSDIWSLGCLLYELAMLKSPFKSEGLNLYSLFQKISQGSYQPLPDTYSEELRSLSYAMISTRPEDRPEINYVCDIANKMKIITAERYQRSRKQTEDNCSKDDDMNIIDIHANNTQPNGNNHPTSLTQQQPHPEMLTIEKKKKTLQSILQQSEYLDEKEFHHKTKSEIPLTPTTKKSSFTKTNSITDNMNTSDNPFRKIKSPASAIKSTNSSNSNSNQPSENGDHSPTSPVDKAVTPRRNLLNGGNLHVNSNTNTSSPNIIRNANQIANSTLTPKNKKTNNNSNEIKNNQKFDFFDTFENNNNNITNKLEEEDDEDMRSVRVNSSRDFQSTKTNDKLSDISSAFSLMNLCYSYLQILNYPFDYENTRIRKILPLEFLCESSMLGLPNNNNTNKINNNNRNTTTTTTKNMIVSSASQFSKFVEVCYWLIMQHGKEGQLLLDKYRGDVDMDTPSAVSSNLLLMAQNLQVLSHESLSSISSTALTIGYGEKVCQFLCAFAESVVRKRKNIWLPFQYDDNNNMASDTIGGNEMDLNEDEEVEDIIDLGKDDAHIVGEASYGHGGEAGGSLFEEMIHPCVEPHLWRAETERVAPLLAEAKRKSGVMDGSTTGNDWSSRVAYIHTQTELHWSGSDIPKTEKVGGGGGGGGTKEESVRTKDILAGLEGMVQELSRDLVSLRRGEDIINTPVQIKKLSEEYRKHKQELIQLENLSLDRSKTVEERSGTLSELEEKVTELIDKLKSKTDPDGSDPSGGSVVNFKEAIKKVKSDVKEMSLRIGLLSSELLTIKQRTATDRLARLKKKTTKNSRLKRNDSGDSGDL